MKGILDFTKPVNIPLFDSVVQVVYGGQSTPGPLLNAAVKILEEYRSHPDAWAQADVILRDSTEIPGKFVALKALDETINKRWNVLPDDSRLGVRNFIIELIMDMSSSPEKLRASKMILEKINTTLVYILKKDWPERWPTFIQEIVDSARFSDALMQNNLAIIRQLSEEIFDFSQGRMTRRQIMVRKEALNSEFPSVFSLINFVLSSKDDPSLINEALKCLLATLSWIPLGFMFETNLVAMLVQRFIPVGITRNTACRCLTEIACLKENLTPSNKELYHQLLHGMLQQLQQIMPICQAASHSQTVSSFYSLPSDSGGNNEEFIQILTQFLTALFKNHLPDLDVNPQNHTAVIEAHYYLLGITHIDDKEMFKACVEYWLWLSEFVFMSTARIGLYAELLSEVRKMMIRRMARPEEVIIFEDDNGEIKKEIMKSVDSIALYNTMREGLIFLTHLDSKDTESIMLDQLLLVRNNMREFSPGILATLCWAIGSISGAMVEEDETKFLIVTIQELLYMCNSIQGHENKASVASDIMYIVGQYPRFLKVETHWNFLKVVVEKLFEFMHEKFEGVKDMAVETFLKISNSCKAEFARTHTNDPDIYISKLVDEVDITTRDLENKQMHIFYEAAGLMIGSAPRGYQDQLVSQLLKTPNQRWSSIMQTAHVNSSNLADVEVMKALNHILKLNVCTAASVGDGYKQQMFNIFADLMQLYALYSQSISSEVATHGVGITKHLHVRQMRIVKKESLRLIEEYVKKSNDTQEVTQRIIPPLLNTVLSDYNKSVEQAKDPQVLSLCTILVSRFGNDIHQQIPQSSTPLST
eukprot:TRINITY_DN16125_c0_g1_i1.p1 TRINITY_DN16125_c0_g1~~TRINITY_DN16125_c0_g1_i1.p1  ORF type:complete len:828 (+),score=123.29 TRINITY_DN16125_c0_g1_i1:42-2486(+)